MNASLTPQPALSRARARRRRGLSLFQALMVLGLAAGAVVGAVTLYNTTTEVQARNDTQALITQLVVATQRIHQGASSYGGTSSTAANLAQTLDVRGSIPASAKTGSGAAVGIRHAFGGALVVEGVGDRFRITLNDLQQANCTQLLDPYIGQARASGGLFSVSNGTTTNNLPMDVAGVATLCADANDNDIELTFE